jgi:hypothetical protein
MSTEEAEKLRTGQLRKKGEVGENNLNLNISRQHS